MEASVDFMIWGERTRWLQTVLTSDEELASEITEADREHLQFTAAA
jgi:hypothetical protein